MYREIVWTVWDWVAAVLRVLIYALGLALDLAVLRRVFTGRGVGPRPKRPTRPQPTVARPVDPAAAPWRPWFRLPGPLSLEHKYGLATVTGMWESHVHDLVAYEHYLNDRLTDAIDEADRALRGGIRPAMTSVSLRDAAALELAARDCEAIETRAGIRVQSPEGFAGAAEVLDALVAARKQLNRHTGAILPPVTVSILPAPPQEPELPAYAVRKVEYDQIGLFGHDPSAQQAVGAYLEMLQRERS